MRAFRAVRVLRRRNSLGKIPPNGPYILELTSGIRHRATRYVSEHMPLVPKSPIPPLPKPVFEAAFGLASKSPWLADHDQGLVELIHLCPTSGCVDLVSSLLGRFRYFFVDAALRETKAAVRFCAEYWQLDAKCCYFVTISDPGRANSGQTILNWMKNELGGDPN